MNLSAKVVHDEKGDEEGVDREAKAATERYIRALLRAAHRADIHLARRSA